MNKAYSELTYWPTEDSDEEFTLRIMNTVGADALMEITVVSVKDDKEDVVMYLPASVLLEMAKDLPDLLELPEPIPYAEEAE